MIRNILLIPLMIFFANITFAQNNQKFALVIGNNEYEGYFPKLTAPENDANDIGLIFKRLNYNTTIVKNATRDSLNYHLKRLRKLANEGSEVVFYFSGHGCWKGDNYYLVPSGEYQFSTSLETDCYLFRSVENQIADIKVPLRILIIDACQNSIDGYKAPMSKRTDNDYLNNSTKAEGIIRFFATGIGNNAKTGNKYSIFTQSLINHLADFGTFKDSWNKISNEVQKISDYKQIPYYNSNPENLIEKIHFNPDKITVSPALMSHGQEYMKFVVTPSNAVITINDTKLNSGENIMLKFGKKYNYKVSSPGYETFSDSFVFEPTMHKIVCTLKSEEPATLVVTCNVKDALLHLDNNKQSYKTPCEITTVSGEHKVRVFKDKYSSQTAIINLKGGYNKFNANIYREYPWFFETDDDGKMMYGSIHYSPKDKTGLNVMYRFDYSKWSIGLMATASFGLFRGIDWGNSFKSITYKEPVTIDTQIDLGNGTFINVSQSREMLYNSAYKKYSPMVDPYNEAVVYNANFTLLANAGYNILNSFIIEGGIGATCYFNRYYMKDRYEIYQTITRNSSTGEIIEVHDYEYKKTGEDFWYKDKAKCSPSLRIGGKFFIPIDWRKDNLIILGGGYTYIPLNHNISTYDICLGFSHIF